MRTSTFLFVALLFSAITVKAQTVATFDTLHLPGTDTAYVNYSNLGNDVGFDDGLAHFPCIYDSSFGTKYWSDGFVYSNKTDSITSGNTNQYSAKTTKGYASSNQYLVAYVPMPMPTRLFLKGAAKGKPVYGFYVTNSTYAYNSMRDGDQFSDPFGGTTGNGPDWFKLIIKGYYNGSLKSDSVEIYLADFRPTNNSLDSILNYWKWVNLLPLGNVDSLQFEMASSDTSGGYINTPTYFCMDNFTTYETSSVAKMNGDRIAKIYPNPAKNDLFIDLDDNNIETAFITDIAGKVLANYRIENKHTSLDISQLPRGEYMLHLSGKKQNATVKFVKQ